jgi:alpha-beta hydrolase superfamily lysophospholipase
MDQELPASTSVEATFPTHDGLQLLSRHWSATGEPKGLSVAIIHGVAEHSGRYDRVVRHLNSAGFDVHAFDLRGHGRSEGRRVHVSRWQDYLDDLARFLDLVAERTGGNPVVLYGHSLGSLIALDFLFGMTGTSSLADEGASVGQPGDVGGSHGPQRAGPARWPILGAILSGSPLRPVGVVRPWKIVAARLLSRLWPTCRLPLNLDPAALSRDKSVVQAFRDDPLVESHGSARWGAEALAALDRIRSRAGQISCPVLILHGQEDSVSTADGSRELYALLTGQDKQLRVYPETLHEPHNDFGSPQVLTDVQHWLEQFRRTPTRTAEGNEP